MCLWIYNPTVNSNKVFQKLHTHACLSLHEHLCVSVLLLHTTQKSALSSSSVDRGHKGTVNEPGTLLLLLKLKTQHDLHANESVCWSLTQLQMDRKQMSINSFNPLMCFIFQSRWDGGKEVCALQPDKPFVDNNNEALIDKLVHFLSSDDSFCFVC